MRSTNGIYEKAIYLPYYTILLIRSYWTEQRRKTFNNNSHEYVKSCEMIEGEKQWIVAV